jgi:citrate lyase subunit beta/citryl-CoA lyase
MTPSDDDVRLAEAIVAAFEAHPDAGVLSVDGKMVDRPHLVQARRILERSR